MQTKPDDNLLACAMNRRQFLVLSATGSASLVLGIAPEKSAVASQSTDILQPFAWIEIHKDNRIIFHVFKSEMGQGATTGLAILVAEELHVGLDQLAVQQAEYDPKYGDQGTGGSNSIHSNWQTLREAGAITRELLLAAASKHWSTDKADCKAVRAEIQNLKTGAKVTYGELVDIALTLPLPKQVSLKKDSYTLIGKSQPRVDLASKVNGTAIYGSDTIVRNMLSATVVHCPHFGGTLRNFDAKAAQAIPGVHRIFEISTGIAIVADNYWIAGEARKQLRINWQRASHKIIPVAEYRNLLDKPGINVEQTGTVPDLSGTQKLEAIYELPYQAHATMEPMSCTAYVHDGEVKVWAPTQTPSSAYSEAQEYGTSTIAKFFAKVLRKVFHKRNADIHVEITQLGGGFGRRLQNDYVAEAVQIAKQVGRPIRLVWSREEDLQHDYYRPATTHRLIAYLRQDTSLASWQHKIVGGSINEYLSPGSTGNGGDHSLTEGATHLAYAMANRTVEYVKIISSVPLGFWRSVGNSHTAFAKECFIDELAHTAHRDPLQYRRDLLKEHPEMIAVLDLAAQQAGWGSSLPAGHYQGLAFHSSYGSHVAEIAEISIEANQRIRVHKVIVAIDCGTVINPDGVRSQMESAVVYGLTATLKSAITVENDRVVQSNFHDFPLLTMQETPHVETYFIKSERPPAGVGEPGLPPIAPAVANAVFTATGQRLRKLPLRLGS